MRWSLLTLLLKAIEQNNDFAFVKYKEHPKDVASIFDTQLIQTIPYEFNKLLGKPVLGFEQEKSILDFLLLFFLQGVHECLKVTAVCKYSPFHGTKISKLPNHATIGWIFQ